MEALLDMVPPNGFGSQIFQHSRRGKTAEVSVCLCDSMCLPFSNACVA